MRGGGFGYKTSSLRDEIFGYSDRWNNALEDREISELTWDLLNLIHDFDWYASGDTVKETYLEAKAEFKKKWFGNRGVRVKATIDKAIEEAKEELYETYGIKEVDDGKIHIGE